MAPDLVLITGATGHLGFRTLTFLLQHGYRARITHRRPEQVDRLKQQAAIQPFLNSIEFTLVPDITASHAYDEAIVGVDSILHIASPVHTGFGPEDTDWQKLLYEPAQKGVTNILQAALKEPRVKRAVITSSVVVLEPKDDSNRAGPYDLRAVPDEESRNNAPTAELAYLNSKILSHTTATHFAETHDTFDIIRILPGYIQGANALYTSAEIMQKPKNCGSNEGILNTAFGNTLGDPRTTAQVFLDDVAKAHVLALRPDVAKHRDNLIVCGNGGNSEPWSDYVPVIKRLFPEAVEKGIIHPKAEDEVILTYFDVSASQKALGFRFAGAEEMVRSVVGQYVRLVESK